MPVITRKSKMHDNYINLALVNKAHKMQKLCNVYNIRISSLERRNQELSNKLSNISFRLYVLTIYVFVLSFLMHTEYIINNTNYEKIIIFTENSVQNIKEIFYYTINYINEYYYNK